VTGAARLSAALSRWLRQEGATSSSTTTPARRGAAAVVAALETQAAARWR